MALNLTYAAIIAALASAVVPFFFYRHEGVAKFSAFILLGLSGISGVVGGGLTLLNEVDVATEIPVGLP